MEPSQNTRNLRLAGFIAAALFFGVGPIVPMVFNGPRRAANKPWAPMEWHMYRTVGVGFCQADIYAERDGKRVDFDKDVLTRSIGRTRGIPANVTHFVVRRKVRANDIVFHDKDELEEGARNLCVGENRERRGSADVRAEMRCSPAYPGGRWAQVEDGKSNLCTRRWAPAKVGPIEKDESPADSESEGAVE